MKNINKIIDKFNESFDNQMRGMTQKILKEDIQKLKIEYKFVDKAMNYILFNFNNWKGFSVADIISMAQKYQNAELKKAS